MGIFFIDTATGQVATLRQLGDAGVIDAGAMPERPWHRIQGPSDASTLWYAVLRKKVGRNEDTFIGALAIRHQPHHASLLERGWEDVPIDQIGAGIGTLGHRAQ
jgi:hypothetical protein